MEQPLYSESQRFSQWWLWLLVLAGAAVGWVAFIHQIIMGRPFGSNPGPDWLTWVILILIGIGMPWFFRSLRLTVSVYSDRLLIRFRPLNRRRIDASAIASCAVREYRPIREYGGWGLRWSPSHGRAYTIHGTLGIQLELKNGKKLLIGSQRAQELCAAISRLIRP